MKYSIITINYNNKIGLEKTILSITSQSFNNYEYIIIDGGSNDGSTEIINKYKDKINFWVSEPDKGVYNAMNKGIAKTTGDYINFMNSGDSFHSSNTLSEIDKIIHNEDIITGSFYDETNSRIHRISKKDVTLLTLLKETFNHQSTFYKKSLFDNRLYDENYRIQSDSKFNMQSIIFDNCSIKVIDTIIANYDFNGISGRDKVLVEEEWQKLLHELYPMRILKDYEKMYTEDEMPLVKLLPRLKESFRAQRIIYYFALFILRVQSLFKDKSV